MAMTMRIAHLRTPSARISANLYAAADSRQHLGL
jgi:hypothetical protein